MGVSAVNVTNSLEESTEEKMKKRTGARMSMKNFPDRKIKNTQFHDDSLLSMMKKREPALLSEKANSNTYDIEVGYDVFIPKESEFVNRKSEVRIYPKVALPHSKPLWDKVRRVRKKVDRPLLRLTTERLGQFTGVEDEEEELRWQGRWGYQWTWNKLDGSRDDEFKSWLIKPNLTGIQKVDCDYSGDNSSSMNVSIAQEKEYVIGKKLSDCKSTTSDILETSLIDTHETRKVSNERTDLKSKFSLDKIVTGVSWYDRKDVISENHEFSKSEIKQKVLTKIKSRLNEQMITNIRSCVIEDSKDGITPLSTPGSCRKEGGLPSMEDKVDADANGVSPASSKKILSVRAKLAAVHTVHL